MTVDRGCPALPCHAASEAYSSDISRDLYCGDFYSHGMKYTGFHFGIWLIDILQYS